MVDQHAACHGGQEGPGLLQLGRALLEQAHERVLRQVRRLLHAMHPPVQPMHQPPVVVAIKRV
ncbi:hypothetical protein D3C71_2053270 [compost metagenome]